MKFLVSLMNIAQLDKQQRLGKGKYSSNIPVFLISVNYYDKLSYAAQKLVVTRQCLYLDEEPF